MTPFFLAALLCADPVERPIELEPAMVRKHFRGKAVVDKTTQVLTLVYDFKQPQQIEDFEVLPGSRGYIARNQLVLDGGSQIVHKARWKTMQVSVAAHVVQMSGKLIGGGSETLATTGGANPDTLYFMGTRVITEPAARRGRIPILFDIEERRATVQYGNDRLGVKLEKPQISQLELWGMDQGCAYSQLTISGIPATRWVKTEFAAELAK
jgi:hypothetical protein